MLTLTRKSGEAIRIGEQVRIVIREIKGRQVRLSIEAPPSIPVFREEIFKEIWEEERSPTPTEVLEERRALSDREGDDAAAAASTPTSSSVHLAGGKSRQRP
ncbi:MAG: carbon storage regulator [Deltaproteobacteria bacterium]|nr:carbon storage regulator [Deltaproteobacteria bacterium]